MTLFCQSEQAFSQACGIYRSDVSSSKNLARSAAFRSVRTRLKSAPEVNTPYPSSR
jgi:hypothetical protein